MLPLPPEFEPCHHFRWTVSLNDGAEWTPFIDATWKRKEK
jgi:hypothetical protein